MSVTLGEILDAIESTLAASSGLTRTQSYDELTEALPRILPSAAAR